jgi:DNA-binding NtrC family response regulator
MGTTVVLAVGLDSWLLANQNTFWKSAGYVLINANTIKEAIENFKRGDFDMVLLGHSISLENKERLTFLIRASGSRTPVVCIADSSDECGAFADATLKNDANAVVAGIGELLAREPVIHHQRYACGKAM